MINQLCGTLSKVVTVQANQWHSMDTQAFVDI